MKQIICILVIFLVVEANKLTLNRKKHYENNYTLQIFVGTQKYDLVTSLSNQVNWIKMDGCTLCLSNSESDSAQNQNQDNQEYDQDCKQSCFTGNEHGVKCFKHYCQKIQNIQNEEPALQGQKVKLNISISNQGQKEDMQIQTLLIQKMNRNYKEIGKFNLLNQGQKFENILLIKDNSPNVSLYYGNQITNVRTWVGKSQKIQVEPEDLNVFELSQIKVKSYDPQEKGSSVLSLPLTKSNIQVSIDTKKLLLPSQTYKKLTSFLLQKYFKESKCNFSTENKIKCKQPIAIAQLQNVTLEFLVNGVQIQIPLDMLFTSCKEKQCQILLGKSKHKKTTILGDFILNTFGIQYNKKDKFVRFYRIDNQWGNIFKDNPLLRTKEVGFLMTLIFIVFKLLYWFIKFIIYCALLSLILNCMYHWRDVMEWFLQIKRKIQEKKASRQLLKMQKKAIKTKDKDKGKLVRNQLDENISSDEQD